ncbi:MAG: alpha/beta hydrolase [Ornithinimicrobium sp.]
MGVLDPDVNRLIETLARMFPVPPADVTPAERRRSYREVQARLLNPSPAASFDGEIQDDALTTEVGEIPVRVYTPTTSSPARDVVVHFPGGGWVIGDLETGDPAARSIAAQMGATVVCVDYRKAPEHPFPAAFEDSRSVVRAVARLRRPRWLGVSGDSSGANLAAAVALDCAATGHQCDGQLLFYPALDPTMATVSHRRCGRGYLLEHDIMAFYWDSYRAGARSDERMAPALASDEMLARVAPVVVATAEFDPLHDEGRDFARRLLGLGVPAAHLPGCGLVHGWVDQTRLVPAAQEALERAIAVFGAMRVARPQGEAGH